MLTSKLDFCSVFGSVRVFHLIDLLLNRILLCQNRVYKFLGKARIALVLLVARLISILLIVGARRSRRLARFLGHFRNDVLGDWLSLTSIVSLVVILTETTHCYILVELVDCL